VSALLSVSTITVLWPKGLNTGWYLDLNRISVHSAWAHGFMHIWALWLGLVVLAGLDVIAYLLGRRGRQPVRAVAAAGLTGVGAVVALALNQPLAHAVAEKRPYDAHPSALVLVARAHDYSFPSDHATIAGAIIVGLLVYGNRWGFLALVTGLFLAFARVYVGAHYPGDVVAGLIYGGVVSGLIFALFFRLVLRLGGWMSTGPLRFLVVAGPVREGAGAAALQ
jgi:membrane-associated phospholipid phosphatase